MCGGAIVGATMSRFTVAPVIRRGRRGGAVSLLIFRFGPERHDPIAAETS